MQLWPQFSNPLNPFWNKQKRRRSAVQNDNGHLLTITWPNFLIHSNMPSSLQRTRCFTRRQKHKLVWQVNVHPCVDCTAIYKIRVGVCVANFSTLGICFFCLLEEYSWEDTLWPLFSVFLAKYDVEAESKKQGTFRDTFWSRQTSNCGHFSGEISVPDIPGRCYEFLSCLTRTWFNWLIVIIY